ncbi:MAG: hypothetical protein IIB71_16875 [Proteobacteria bacterium]|nr:hypothetical protein [Pseudomonadota bacterium]
MIRTILAIGLNKSLIDELDAVETMEIYNTNSCSEAIDVLHLQEVTTIVFDSNASNCVETDLHSLLSATPVTTRIVLITPTTNISDNLSFSNLGITTLTAPVSGSDLEPYFN